MTTAPCGYCHGGRRKVMKSRQKQLAVAASISASDVTKQLAANPRLARLYQLSTQKRCTAAQLK
jgi:hypothetical protein